MIVGSVALAGDISTTTSVQTNGSQIITTEAFISDGLTNMVQETFVRNGLTNMVRRTCVASGFRIQSFYHGGECTFTTIEGTNGLIRTFPDTEQYSWRDFPRECCGLHGSYLLIMGLLYLAVFVIGCLVLAVLAIKQRGTFLKRVGRFGLFLGLFLIVGSIFNGLWGCLVYGHLYYQYDFFGCDFLPFVPFTQRGIDGCLDYERWHFLGISLFQLQLVWFSFAAGTWGGTILLYRLVNGCLWNRKFIPKHPDLH